jgi:hypothetical protein
MTEELPLSWKALGNVACIPQSAASLDSRIYYIEGNNLQCYDPRSAHTRTLSSESWGTTRALVEVNGKLLTFGKTYVSLIDHHSGEFDLINSEGWKYTRTATSHEGLVYCTTCSVTGFYHGLYQVNPADGTWKKLSSDSIWTSTRAMVSCNGQLISFHTSELRSTDPSTGNSTVIKPESWDNVVAACTMNGSIYCVTSYRLKTRGNLYQVDPSTGSYIQLSSENWGCTTALTSYGGILYAFAQQLYAISLPITLPKQAYIDYSSLHLIKEIGSGNFGSVFETEWKGEQVVAKVVVDGSYAETMREISINLTYRHPRISMCYGWSKQPNSKKLLMVLKYYQHGSLESKLAELTLPMKLQASLQVAIGLRFLHEHNCIHRDIAARNVLVESLAPSLSVVICDLGLAQVSSDYLNMNSSIPWPYLAIEALHTSVPKFTEGTDVWAYGLFIWELFRGSGLFAAIREDHLFSSVVDLRLKLSNGWIFPKPDHCPDEIYSLMLECWRPEDERITLDTVVEQLKQLISDS